MITRRSTLIGLGSCAYMGALPACSKALEPAPKATNVKVGFALLSRAAQALVADKETAGVAVGMTGLGFRKSAYFGLSNRDTGALVGPATQFRIASVTKPIVAAAALQMEEEGRLSLSAPLSEFLPSFPRAREVTLTQLLQHTSGLANWWGRLPDDAPDDFMNRPDAAHWLARMQDPYLFQPGTMRSYSNSGYVVLGKALENAAQAMLGEILASNVLDRVGATNTGFEDTDAARENWATGYQRRWSGFEVAPLVPAPFAAGGLRSTLHDQLAFCDALFLGPLLEPEPRQRMLSHATVADGRRVQDALFVAPGETPEDWPEDTSELGYGLGINTWVQMGERFYSHAGLIDGFSSYLLHAPRVGVSVSVLSNTFQGTGGLGQIARDILRTLN